MNSVVLVGRLSKDPETRYGQTGTAVTTYTLAVNRTFKRDGEPSAVFLRCVAFGKAAEFADKYFRKGMRVAVSGHIQTGSYTGKDGNKVYTTDIVIESQEFAQNKGEAQRPGEVPEKETWYTVPEGVDDENIPFP